MKLWDDFIAAFSFLTRLPTPRYSHDAGTIARSSKFFPLVCLIVAGIAYLFYLALLVHAAKEVRCIVVLCVLVLLTGGFHEDGLADAADGFGGGWTRDRVLEIMHDSRIGSYGALALFLSLMLRLILLINLGTAQFWPYLAAAHVLCRWSTLPLSFLLPPARMLNGKGASVAQKISRSSFLVGTIFTVAVCIALLHTAFLAPVLASIAVVFASAAYYRRRIGGITGDCFGATNQLVEIATYFCGVLT